MQIKNINKIMIISTRQEISDNAFQFPAGNLKFVLQAKQVVLRLQIVTCPPELVEFARKVALRPFSQPSLSSQRISFASSLRKRCCF